MHLLSFRWLLLFIVLATVALLGFGIYLQKVLGIEPCPLCIFQRIGFIAVGVLALFAALHNPRPLGRRLWALLIVLAALAGGSVSARHVWLRHLPADQVPDCGPGLAYMLDAFPLGKTIKDVFTGSGECATPDGWWFLGLDMPSWALVWFAGFSLIALYAGFFARGKPSK
ncbi:MAG: disulfide bond formation protein B [Lysobacterales bacterium]